MPATAGAPLCVLPRVLFANGYCYASHIAFFFRAQMRACFTLHARRRCEHVSHGTHGADMRTSTSILYKLPRNYITHFREYAKIPRLFMTVYTAWEIPVHLRTRAHSQCVFRKLPCAVPAMDTNAVSYTC